MGYLKEKYTKEYFLGSVDKKTNKIYGVAGFESFKQRHIDKRYQHFLSNLNLKGKVILDMGCGRGEVVNCCVKKGAKKVIGIDFSKDAIKIASEFNRNNSNVELIEMEAKDLNFKDVFDVVFMLDVIEHIPNEEMQIIYYKTYSALKKEGILILNTPIQKSISDKDASDFTPATMGMHCNKQTKGTLTNDLAKYKFRKYSVNVWVRSDNFLPSVFLYAKILNFKIFLQNFKNFLMWEIGLALWYERISHPKRTLNKVFKRLFSNI